MEEQLLLKVQDIMMGGAGASGKSACLLEVVTMGPILAAENFQTTILPLRHGRHGNVFTCNHQTL